MPDQLTPEQEALIKELSGRTDLSPQQREIVNELMSRIAPEPDQKQPVETEPAETFLGRVARTARPYLQATGATGGAIIGAGSGLFTGPGAVAASPAGAVIGGGIGFAIGDEIADLLENYAGKRKPQPLVVELTESGKRMMEGAAYEMGGQAIGPALKVVGETALKSPAIRYSVEAGKEMLGKAPAMTKAEVERLAGRFLHANTSKGPIIAKNIETAQAIEKQIPGLKFTFGEMTGDPGIIKLERATMREPGGFAQEMIERQRANDADIKFAQEMIERQRANDAAIKNAITSRRPQGEIGDVIETLGSQEKAASEAIEAAQQRLSSETEKMGMGIGSLEAGQTIRAEAKAGEQAVSKKASELFGEIPNEPVDANAVLNKIDDLTTPADPFEDITQNIPEEFATIKDALLESNGQSTAQSLQNLRSRLVQRLRDMRSGMERNRFKESKLSQLIGSIDESLDAAGSLPGQAGEQLKGAREFFKKEVIQKFRQGNVGDILKPGREGYRVTDAQVASKFFKPGAPGKQAAQQFNAAIGTNAKAKQAIEDAVKQDLLSKFAGEEITENGLRRWLNRNKQALDELGLTDKFGDLKKAREQLTDALQFQKDFQKSEAAKIIGSDPDIAVKTALGAKNTGRAAASLMAATKGNKQAQAGLRNALEDYMLSQSSNFETGMVTKIDTLDKLTKKYRPALNVFYSGDKEALKAWDTARQAFRIAQKERKSPIGTGSDTAENVLTSVYKALGVSSGRVGTLVRAILDPLKKSEMSKVNALVNRALLNPDYAYTLMQIAKKPLQKNGQLPRHLQRRLSQHIAVIGGATLRPLENKEPAQ